MITRKQLDEIAAKRIVILDGAMGSLIQGFNLTEDDFRGKRFADHPKKLLGCNDLLCLTRPDRIGSIHEDYLKAGADIIETCSFNSTSISLDDYGIGELAYEISAAAAIARQAADKYATPDKPRFVAGSMGPTAKSASMSPDMNDPGKRAVTWDELEAAYYDNARGLLDGGADILLLETMFDTLNAKAALFAINRLMRDRGIPEGSLPLMLSATVSNEGRVLSGQTVEAFAVSVAHIKPWSIGLNCSFGAERLKASVKELAAFSPCLISAHPNAGLPNRLGAYDETPQLMAAHIEEYLKEGLVNIIGGCCGSTPEHIALIAEKAAHYAPRTFTAIGQFPPEPKTYLAGFEPLLINFATGCKNIGTRTNVAKNRDFLRIITEGDYDGAVELAREAVDQGADIIGVCMDDAALDAKAAMTRFLNFSSLYPDIARQPFMIDSSQWEVVEAGLKCVQGKALVYSISLKDGEAELLRTARLVRAYGAAAVVTLFDEQGQAVSYERQIEAARRSYELLTNDGFPPEDIVFDANMAPACEWIRANCPHVHIIAGDRILDR